MNAASLSILLALSAPPNTELVCPAPEAELSPTNYLRALALDLTGRPPDDALVEAVLTSGEVDDATLDALLDSEGFVERVVRRHRTIFWPNLTNVSLTAVRASLATTGGRNWVRTKATTFRGQAIECLDEPARWDANGAIITTPYTMPDGKVALREGWIEVEPYWLPVGQKIRVCAFDGQSNAVSASGTSCTGRDGLVDPGCGCGPELQWCRQGNADLPVQEAMAGDLERRVGAMIEEDRPYLDLFTSTRAFVNGPLVHFLKHRAGELTNNTRFDPLPLDVSALPNLHYRDRDAWTEITLGNEHAGVLTSWAFLARFQTARARANRFYNAFLCQPFQPPAAGIPIDPSAALEPDLQKRAGCKYCHALLEPSSSFWGRWTESGAGHLAPDRFPAYSETCRECGLTGTNCTRECRDFYVISAATPAEKANLGKLWWYSFRRPEHEKNIEQGPRLLAYEGIVDGRLPVCVARSTAEWLLGRKLADAELPWADQMATSFAADGYSFKRLVRSVVTSDVYRRIQ